MFLKMSKIRPLHKIPISRIHSGSIYVHWPYCRKRCSYCNFNKYILSSDHHKSRKTPWIVPEERLVKALITELRSLLRISGIQEVSSVYFGGGTPSLMDPESINLVLRELPGHSLGNVEITLEANPEDLMSSRSKLQGFKDAGINRLSLGIQAFNDSDLKEMNRCHGLLDSIESIENSIRVFGRDRVSLDLIFGRNESQTLVSWIHELDTAASFGVGHLSLYQLTVERGTPLWKDRISGSSTPPKEDLVHEMYIESIKTLKDHGFHRYEVSNFARSSSTQSRHNIHYWRGGEYIGIGPGAHGRFIVRSSQKEDYLSAIESIKGNSLHSQDHRRQERIQTLEPHDWAREVEMVGHGTRRVNPLSVLDSCIELLGSGLRTSNGVQREHWDAIASELGISLKDLVIYSDETVGLIRDGLIDMSPDSLALSEGGMNITDYIASCLVSNLISLVDDNKRMPI